LDGRHGVKKADVDFFVQLKEAFEKLDGPKDGTSGGKGSSAPKALKAERAWKPSVLVDQVQLVERKVSQSLVVLCRERLMFIYILQYVCMYVLYVFIDAMMYICKYACVQDMSIQVT